MSISIVTRGYICPPPEITPIRVVFPIKLKIKKKTEIKLSIKKC
jgi:hypothetical protein